MLYHISVYKKPSHVVYCMFHQYIHICRRRSMYTFIHFFLSPGFLYPLCTRSDAHTYYEYIVDVDEMIEQERFMFRMMILLTSKQIFQINLIFCSNRKLCTFSIYYISHFIPHCNSFRMFNFY